MAPKAMGKPGRRQGHAGEIPASKDLDDLIADLKGKVDGLIQSRKQKIVKNLREKNRGARWCVLPKCEVMKLVFLVLGGHVFGCLEGP